MGKFALILVASFTFVFATIKNELNTISENAVDTFVDHYDQIAVRATAASAANIALGELTDDDTFAGAGYSSISLNGATFSIGIVDSTVVVTLTSEQSQITGTATTSEDTATSVIIAEKKSIVPEIIGSMGTNATLTSFNLGGNATISGNDIDAGGTDLPGITVGSSTDSASVIASGVDTVTQLTGSTPVEVGTCFPDLREIADKIKSLVKNP